MSDDRRKMAWSQIIFSALITAFLSIITSVVVYHYQRKMPDLVYEKFPPAHFEKQDTRISIYNVWVENIGNKEAEDVNVYFELPLSCNIQDIKVEPNLKSIKYTITSSQPNLRNIRLPLLNPKDQCRFSILVDQGEIAQIQVEVRGKGLTGHISKAENDSTSLFTVISSIIAIFALVVSIVTTWLAKFRSESKLDDMANWHHSRLDKEIQFIRTQKKQPQKTLEHFLLNNKFRLFFK